MKPTREEIEKALTTLSGQFVRLGIKAMCTRDEWRAFQTVLAAAEQHKASAPLPENVEAFVAEVGERWRGIPDVTRLCAIVRAQGAELAKCRSMFVSIVEWADERTISHDIADREPLDRWIGEAGLRGQEVAKLRRERDALAARLAKLETGSK